MAWAARTAPAVQTAACIRDYGPHNASPLPPCGSRLLDVDGRLSELCAHQLESLSDGRQGSQLVFEFCLLLGQAQPLSAVELAELVLAGAVELKQMGMVFPQRRTVSHGQQGDARVDQSLVHLAYTDARAESQATAIATRVSGVRECGVSTTAAMYTH